MASSLPAVVDDDLLRCRLCCRIAVEPKLLPCLHVFCGSCLDKHLDRVSVELRPDDHAPRAKLGAAPSTNSKDRRPFGEAERKVAPGAANPRATVSSDHGADEESYEIPQRTIDDDGYQIADESAFTGGSYDNNNGDDNYYNQITDAPSNAPYLEMTNKRNSSSSRAAKNPSRKTGPASTMTDLRVLRTFSECSGEYVPPGATSLETSPGDLYDNVEDVASSVTITSQSSVDRKSDSPIGVRRWKVSSAAGPPMMVRKKKTRSGLAYDGDQPKGGEDAVTETLAPERGRPTPSKESLPTVAAPREDIYRDPELSPPLSELYAADGSTSTGVYQLQKRMSDAYPGRISPLASRFGSQEKLLPHAAATAVEGTSRTRGSVKKFNCPVCEDLIRVKDATKALETCSFVSALLDVSSFSTDDQVICRLCCTGAATHRCFDCRSFLCGACKDGHGGPGETQGHSVASLTDVRAGKHQNELQDMLSSRCRDHPEQTASYLCLVCKRLVCSECLSSSDHDEHWAAPVDEVATRERSYLESVVESVKERLETITDERKRLNNYRLRSDEDRVSVMRDIIRQKETLIQLIEAHSSTLLERVEQDFCKERLRIERGLSKIDSVRFKMQSSLKFVDQLLEHGRPADIFELSKVVRARLHALEALTPPSIEGRLAVGFHPTAIAADDIEQLFGVLTVSQPDEVVPPERDSARNPRTEPQTSPATTTTPSVTPKLLWAFPTKTVTDDKGCKPTGVALTGDGDTEALVLVDDINKKLKIFRMDGILENEVFPTGDRRLVDPWDVVVLDGGSGDFAVTDRGAREVKIFRRSGEFVSSFGPHLGNPWGIATNSLGNILVTDIVHRKVFVHDSSGRLVSSIPHGSGADDCLRCPEYVSVNVNDDVIVSDFEQHCVVIFDKFGRFVARYGGERGETGVGRLKVPCGVCVSPEGDIFVADYNNRRIVRLTMNGRLRCHYATNDAQLVKPQALTIDRRGQLVVVDRTHVKIFSVDLDHDSVQESRPKPKPRRKSEDARVKHGAKKTPSAPPVYKREYTQKYSADRPGSSAIESVGEREIHDTNDVTKPFLETEVW